MVRDVKANAGRDINVAEGDINIGQPKAAETPVPTKPAQGVGDEKPKSFLEQATKFVTSTTGLVTAGSALVAAVVAAGVKLGWFS